MAVTTNHEMRYDAFISYRHSELDKFVAEELHKQLETFKIPKKISEKCKKKRINRIFRDKDELPITSNLADPIMNALRQSEFLIVICSPRLKESLWCKREIENFISMHGQEKVLAVLIEGEPNESFPDELLYREKTIVLESGETTVVKEAVEPLAADVRGKNKKEIKKLIKTEMLRLLASMLQCNYDDLKQRHKERKMHRMLALAAGVCFVGLAFGTVSTVMALQIRNQKEQIDRQYWEALETNAIMSADNALELLDGGDRIGAVAMSRELLPDDLANPNIPYTSEAFFALTQSVYPYAAGNVLRPIFQIQENAEIKDIMLSHNRNRVCVRTKYDQLTVWDIPNKEKCLELDLNKISRYSIYDEGVAFLGEDKLALLAYNEILIVDMNSGESDPVSGRISSGNNDFPRRLFTDADSKYIVAVFASTVCVYDAKSTELIYTYTVKDNLETVEGEISFRGEDELIVVCGTSGLDDKKEDFEIQRINIKNGNIINTFVVPYGKNAIVDANQDSLFVAVNGDSKEVTSIFDTVDDADIYCFDIETGAKRWEYHTEDEYINSIVVPYEGYDCFLFESYAQITALERNTGEVIGQFSFGSEIVNIYPLQTADTYVVFTREGGRINFMPEKNYNVELAGTFISATGNVKETEWGSNYIVALPYFSKELIVYDWYMDEGAKELVEFGNSVLEFVVSEDEKYSVIELIGYEMFVMDNATNEILGQITCDSFSRGLHFIGDDKIQRVCSDEVFIYDLQCNLIEQYKLSEEFIMIDSVSRDGKYAFADDSESMFAINCATKEMEIKLLKELCEYDTNCSYAFSNSGDMCVITDKSKGQCRNYDTSTGTLIQTIDINATYIENICFSENDNYVYFVFEDGKVAQYYSESMEQKCEVNSLDKITEVIVEEVQDGVTKYYFYNASGAYVLSDYDGQLKVEQFIPLLQATMVNTGEYWLVDYKSLVSFPMYTYEEILGKAERICYDNSLWNNN